MDKVLIIEENKVLQNTYIRTIACRADLKLASDLDEAYQQFLQYPDIRIITISGNPPGVLRADDFIAMVRESFSGPIISTSFFSTRRYSARAAGADYFAEKHELGVMVIRLLKSVQ